MVTYVPLHAHTAPGSVGDAIMKVEDYIEKAKELKLPAIAVTDHGSMASIYHFYHECLKNDIKPILGCEVYETPDRLVKTKESSKLRHHLLLLAKNNIGFKNLLAINNDAASEGFYYKPCTDVSFMKEHGEGIIATSACVGGKVAQAILNNDIEAAKKYIYEFKEIFDEFYLEIQPGRFSEQLIVNRELIKLSEETDTPLVVTNDIHYLNKQDSKPHDVHVKIRRKHNLDDPPEYPDDIYYLMDGDHIIDLFNNTVPIHILKEAIQNTIHIAEQTNVTLSKEVVMPKYLTDDSADAILTRKSFAKLEELEGIVNMPLYTSRLLYELDTIITLGFSDYFLIVEDLIDHAHEAGIPVGPGRGSVGGSLVAHLLGISIADPIKYNLLFERFLSVKRKSIPDIDLDFASEKRNLMREYAVQKYGQEHCSLVSTFQMRKSRSALRDMARVAGIDKEIADKAAKLVPQVYYDDDGEKMTDLSIEEAIQAVPELKEMAEEYPEWFDMAIKLSGVPSATSIHAAGIIISPLNLSEVIPLIKSNTEGIAATSLSLGDAESAGTVKFDFLSLASLSIYENTMKQVGIDFNYATNKFDDEKVWDLIGSKYTTGLFQISSKTYKSRMPRLKPKSVSELAHCLALLRGPCISSGADKDYMDILEGKKDPDYIHELYWKATSETQGIVLYQEQVMQLAVNFGFSLEQSYDLMKAVSKKKPEKIRAFKVQFMENAEALNVPLETADEIFEIIQRAGQYCFNQAHAVSYALLCYASAYLKTYYPKEFIANLLTNAYQRSKSEEVIEAIEDCRRLGFKFLPIDINRSGWEFRIEDDKIRMGFCSIKGFGEKAAQEVISKQPYASLEDFQERITKKACSKNATVPLIMAGSFGEFYEDSKSAYIAYCSLRNEDPLDDIKVGKEYLPINSKLDHIEEMILGGLYISDPANAMEPTGFRTLPNKKIAKINAYIHKVKRTKDRNGKQMAFLTLATGDGYIDCTVFSETYAKNKKQIRKNSYVTLSVKKDGDYSCLLKDIA